jgi:hypothetical protein
MTHATGGEFQHLDTNRDETSRLECLHDLARGSDRRLGGRARTSRLRDDRYTSSGAQ